MSPVSRGTKPPIWRRLELPADTGLAKLHGIIQVAFDWENAHLHVFETAFGDFGIPDRELGHRSETPVTLEQVAPTVGDKLQYTYDFGDGRTHEITLEKVLDRVAVAYPRCTGGRRAAPPEDCGGVWGFAELVEVLADPTHPEHEERLKWLDLGSPADFDRPTSTPRQSLEPSPPESPSGRPARISGPRASRHLRLIGNVPTNGSTYEGTYRQPRKHTTSLASCLVRSTKARWQSSGRTRICWPGCSDPCSREGSRF